MLFHNEAAKFDVWSGHNGLNIMLFPVKVQGTICALDFASFFSRWPLSKNQQDRVWSWRKANQTTPVADSIECDDHDHDDGALTVGWGKTKDFLTKTGVTRKRKVAQ